MGGKQNVIACGRLARSIPDSGQFCRSSGKVNEKVPNAGLKKYAGDRNCCCLVLTLLNCRKMTINSPAVSFIVSCFQLTCH